MSSSSGPTDCRVILCWSIVLCSCFVLCLARWPDGFCVMLVLAQDEKPWLNGFHVMLVSFVSCLPRQPKKLPFVLVLAQGEKLRHNDSVQLVFYLLFSFSMST